MSYGMQRAAVDAAVAWTQKAAEWEFFVTPTFAADVSEATAKNALRTWLREIARAVGHHVAFTYVMGPQPDSGRMHFHVLLAFNGAAARIDLALAAWRASKFPTGTIDALPYEATGGILHYIIEGHPTWEPANLACPRTGQCAHRRCAHAPIGWK